MSSSIVQEWSGPGGSNGNANANSIAAAAPITLDTNNTPAASQSPLSPSLEELVRRAAQENGVERPKGYTVSMHYNPEVEDHHFGRLHPMKPWRLQLTKQLILSYGLHYAMDLYETREASMQELALFHKQEYLDYLAQITPDNILTLDTPMSQFNFGDDCPVFDGLYRYCALYTGATLSATHNLLSNSSDIAINWSGGLHHAKKSEASGFCYVNDIVVAIIEMLRYHPRILYVDIDVHHGDGVEQAFASTDRVLTLSFHKYDPETFFPGTGGVRETGPENPRNPGAHHSLNVPLRDGIDDDQYTQLFKDVTAPCVAAFNPTAIVLQCGADSLGGDRLGKFNLNIRAHGECVDFIKSFRLPLLILGGGGYTARNVARLWCHETSVLTETQLPDETTIPGFLPARRAFEGAEHGDALLYPSLHNIEGRRHKNEHDPAYLEMLVKRIREQLRYLKGAPSVQMTQIPRGLEYLRRDVDRAVKEEMEEKEAAQAERRRKDEERNIGARGELVP